MKDLEEYNMSPHRAYISDATLPERIPMKQPSVKSGKMTQSVEPVGLVSSPGPLVPPTSHVSSVLIA